MLLPGYNINAILDVSPENLQNNGNRISAPRTLMERGRFLNEHQELGSHVDRWFDQLCKHGGSGISVREFATDQQNSHKRTRVWTPARNADYTPRSFIELLEDLGPPTEKWNGPTCPCGQINGDRATADASRTLDFIDKQQVILDDTVRNFWDEGKDAFVKAGWKKRFMNVSNGNNGPPVQFPKRIYVISEKKVIETPREFRWDLCMCLSHRWGAMRGSKLVPWKMGLSDETLYHVGEVLENYGIDFLWVDTHCVNQAIDDAGFEDRKEEMGRMGLYYGTARGTAALLCPGHDEASCPFGLVPFPMWFSRAWIVQEIAMANALIFIDCAGSVCGPCGMPDVEHYALRNQKMACLSILGKADGLEDTTYKVSSRNFGDTDFLLAQSLFRMMLKKEATRTLDAINAGLSLLPPSLVGHKPYYENHPNEPVEFESAEDLAAHLTQIWWGDILAPLPIAAAGSQRRTAPLLAALQVREADPALLYDDGWGYVFRTSVDKRRKTLNALRNSGADGPNVINAVFAVKFDICLVNYFDIPQATKSARSRYTCCILKDDVTSALARLNGTEFVGTFLAYLNKVDDCPKWVMMVSEGRYLEAEDIDAIMHCLGGCRSCHLDLRRWGQIVRTYFRNTWYKGRGNVSLARTKLGQMAVVGVTAEFGHSVWPSLLIGPHGSYSLPWRPDVPNDRTAQGSVGHYSIAKVLHVDDDIPEGAWALHWITRPANRRA
ncbi:hypothetical protein BDZ88DRAFT_441907 [Geranomyces variabilis]|nr:hypothetical protein BDZ88DRAFT_441907 [Geranomyces variabilis]KAJ3134262.1 hypothetical protein HDU90_005128 [Geranomyces variabilis]